MKADDVDPYQLAAMLKEVGRKWADAHARVRCAPEWAGVRTTCQPAL